MQITTFFNKKSPIFRNIATILCTPVRYTIFLTHFLFFLSNSVISAQTSDGMLNRRLVWRPAEHTIGYSVEIDRLTGGTYSSHLREYTTEVHLDVSLPAGDYRFRVIPHDILGRSYEAAASAWIDFKVFRRPGIVEANIVVIGLNEEEERKRSEELEKRSEGIEKENEELEIRKDVRRFNSLGVSLGTSFVDPVVTASAQGTFSPVRNFYIEAGCGFGFVSVYDDAENYYSVYPFLNLGYFMPFSERGGLFFGAGAGYMISEYSFKYGKDNGEVFAVNINAGLNLWDTLNISWALRTDFAVLNQTLKVGYTYRFR